MFPILKELWWFSPKEVYVVKPKQIMGESVKESLSEHHPNLIQVSALIVDILELDIATKSLQEL